MFRIFHSFIIDQCHKQPGANSMHDWGRSWAICQNDGVKLSEARPRSRGILISRRVEMCGKSSKQFKERGNRGREEMLRKGRSVVAKIVVNDIRELLAKHCAKHWEQLAAATSAWASCCLDTAPLPPQGLKVVNKRGRRRKAYSQARVGRLPIAHL